MNPLYIEHTPLVPCPNLQFPRDIRHMSIDQAVIENDLQYTVYTLLYHSQKLLNLVGIDHILFDQDY